MSYFPDPIQDVALLYEDGDYALRDWDDDVDLDADYLYAAMEDVGGLTAGAIVGQGSSGCVFAPSLRSKQPGTLSKLMCADQARDELQHAKRMAVLDPAGRYGIYPSALLQPMLPHDLKHERDLDECEVKYIRVALGKKVRGGVDSIRKSMCRTLASLEYPQATKDLYKALQKSPPRRSLPTAIAFLSGVHNLLRGLEVYHRGGMVHLDIKVDNVVLMGDVAAPSTLKFIDFNLSSTLPIKPDTCMMFEEFSYVHFSPAICALMADSAPSNKLLKGFLADYRRNNSDRTLKEMFSLCGWASDTLTPEGINRALGNMGCQGKSVDDLSALDLRRVATRTDVYGVGCILHMVVHQLWPSQGAPLTAMRNSLLSLARAMIELEVEAADAADLLQEILARHVQPSAVGAAVTPGGERKGRRAAFQPQPQVAWEEEDDDFAAPRVVPRRVTASSQLDAGLGMYPHTSLQGSRETLAAPLTKRS